MKLRNQRIGQLMGKETMLECIVTAYPQAEAYWEKDGRRLLSGDRHRVEVYQDEQTTVTLSLRVHTITASDFGVYRCVAANTVGKAERSMLLYGKTGTILEYTTRAVLQFMITL